MIVGHVDAKHFILVNFVPYSLVGVSLFDLLLHKYDLTHTRTTHYQHTSPHVVGNVHVITCCGSHAFRLL